MWHDVCTAPHDLRMARLCPKWFPTTLRSDLLRVHYPQNSIKIWENCCKKREKVRTHKWFGLNGLVETALEPEVKLF